ncbi:MAG TPA: hypothetical protein VE964_07895, partial [Myxococcales bacterium]|nr:hypothetical protein [Myxococcales bacterium]
MGAHSASLEHAVGAHALPLQVAPPQESCTTAGHAPVPLHTAASLTTPAEQLWARHWTAELGYAHWVALLPSH